MDLFLEPTAPVFEKVAAEVTLPEDPAQWQHEILQEAYKQAPYISDFQPDVVMERVDAERGTAIGFLEVGNKTELPAGHPSAEAAGVRQVRIPIVVTNRKLQPLDLIATDTGQMLPLTERRLRQALFRPQIFDVAGRSPGDRSLVSSLYPPYRQNYGLGGVGGLVTKEGSARVSLLEALLPTINEGDYVKFASCLQKDEQVRLAYQTNKTAMAALQLLAQYRPSSGADLITKIATSVNPGVIQFCRDNSSYTVKTASASCWFPVLRRVDRGELVKIAGADTALLVDKAGSATATLEDRPVETDPIEEESPKLITEFGVYKVQDTDGNHLIGYVFPHLLDLHGDIVPLSLFTNGSHTALQGEVVGVRVGEGMSVINGTPRGYGAFYKILPNGKAQAMVPLELVAGSIGPDGQTGLLGRTVEGEQIEVQLHEGLSRPVRSDEQHLLVPADWRWLPLEESKAVALAETPDQFSKVASALTVTLRSDGAGSFSLSGPAIDKVAEDQRSFVDVDDALFYLGAMGVHPEYAAKKLAQAMHAGVPVDMVARREIVPLEELRKEAQEKAASSKLPNLRRDLVKEAAFLPDPMAVDTVLSLGFLNPENLITFVSYMPQLDETQRRLCELLLAARLGLKEVNEGALERAIRATEDVIEGLNVLSFQTSP